MEEEEEFESVVPDGVDCVILALEDRRGDMTGRAFQHQLSMARGP